MIEHVQEDGRSVSFGFQDLFIPGETNPVTGSDIVATLELEGAFVQDDLLCGTVSGRITSPLVADLNGSTFAAVALDGRELPTELTTGCPSIGEIYHTHTAGSTGSFLSRRS